MKFVVTGGINTFVDFAVLNGLILALGLAQGDPKYIYFKAFSYCVASCNSFMLNKWWVFKKGPRAAEKRSDMKSDMKKEVGSFAFVSVLGLAVNLCISLLVFHAAAAVFPGSSPALLANIGAVSGTITVLLFNFFAYKFFIFK